MRDLELEDRGRINDFAVSLTMATCSCCLWLLPYAETMSETFTSSVTSTTASTIPIFIVVVLTRFSQEFPCGSPMTSLPQGMPIVALSRLPIVRSSSLLQLKLHIQLSIMLNTNDLGMSATLHC